MDSLTPVYSPFASSSSESNASNGPSTNQDYPSQARPDAESSLPCHPTSSTASPRSEQDQPELSNPQLYSPSRAEIESHPIRQRLSVGRDEITTSYGTALEADSEPLEDSRQAQEGSDRWFDAMSSDAPAVKEGDAVTYAWGSGQPGGVVSKVSEDSVTMTTKNDNEVKKQGEPGNPAVYIERDGHDVVKKASEVEVEEKGADSDQKKEESKEKEDESEDKEEDKQENGEPQTGDKRPAEESAEDKKEAETNGTAKKQKTASKPKENGEPKKKGRPAKTDAEGNPIAKKDTKKRAPKKAATESGEPRRSGRNADK